MSKLIKYIAKQLIKSDSVWAVLPQTSRGVFKLFFFVRNGLIEGRLVKKVAKRGVLLGPFAGMTYRTTSFASAHWPKLIGSYENELHDVILELKKRKYELVVDVGCAEGYYAVGLALWNTVDSVVAYDIELDARKACKELCELNRIDNKVQIRTRCTTEDLIQCYGKKSLVISDCEGFEKELFTTQALPWLSKTDLIIECHEHLAPGITVTLETLFSSTHFCKRISAVNATSKCDAISELLGETNLAILCRLVEEGRPDGMQWLVALAIKNASGD